MDGDEVKEKNEVFDILAKLQINYDKIEHKAVYTVEETRAIVHGIVGLGCKNLFLRDELNNKYIYVLDDDKRVDLKHVKSIVGCKNLSFADEFDLYDSLHLKPGSVTPLGICNNYKKDVIILLDVELRGKCLLVHPNTNTCTVSIQYVDLIKYIDYIGNKYIEIY